MAAVNVTLDLVAWNATQGPSVSHTGVYPMQALDSRVALVFDLRDTLAEAGASAGDISQYFVRLTVRLVP